ncbi:alpha-amylase family glycosyl hydrolase [Flavobacterium sp. NRK F10]|uniref:alpha-amylase family glycosyl hydrolase n=1 Tax=Flavobacterium sp. NRK F10 TaxID=2954931 RepID=UPI002090DF14|nr:alpha-amylase family glycosyl hydrolase [Flavobacterium sp. NRK F10]MCO6174271.1 alpha-amylase family glycosyl hydrolase [Flavobacterium sp. NRK F10]
MKKIILSVFAILILMSCKKEKSAEIQPEEPKLEAINETTADNAVIYEANIRQYSPEGTFNEFTKDIPKVKELGVKILWLMPIHEIGVKNRKAKGELSVEDITDTVERKKYLGSYYSIKDYRSINKEFGSAGDLHQLVETAHQNGIYVILDWVANHTAWDHPWVTEHNDFYTHDEKGNMIAPFDWTDVAELNYDNPELRKAMIADMKYWITNFDIDGFRCDVAGEVPTDFWNEATAQLRKEKPVFMLAEAEKPELMKQAFNMQYGWDVHHIFNDIAQGKKTVKDFDAYMTKIDTLLDKDDIYMNFTSNHDENSWNGTEFERMGDAVEAFAALSYVMPGMPLIYNGQEYDLKKRLKFFEKDTIPHVEGKMMKVYEKLGKLKAENPALSGGEHKASYKRIPTSNDNSILVFEREKEGKKVVFIANLSAEEQNVTFELDQKYKDYNAGKPFEFKKEEGLKLEPWQYYILVN